MWLRSWFSFHSITPAAWIINVLSYKLLLKLLWVLFSLSCVSCCLCCLWLVHTKWSAALCCHGNWGHVHNAFSLIAHYQFKIVFLRSVFNFFCWELNALSLSFSITVWVISRGLRFQDLCTSLCVGDKLDFSHIATTVIAFDACECIEGCQKSVEAKNTHSVPYMAPLAFSVCLFVSSVLLRLVHEM